MDSVDDPTLPADLHRDAAQAASSGDWRNMIALGDRLERMGHYVEAWRLLASAPLLKSPGIWPEWNGELLDGRALLVRRRIRHVGAELRMARFIGAGVQAGARVSVRGDARVAPLIGRTFGLPAEDPDRFDFETSYEGLARHFGSSASAIEAQWRPLLPDGGMKATWQGRYSSSGARPVGISWFSRNAKKDLPGEADWAGLLASRPGAWCSLQYDEYGAGLDRLRSAGNVRIADSAGLDQFADIDGFAAQVAATGGVLTISNTTAHMAGALGVPCVVMLDEGDHLSWPGAGNSPFYPTLRLVRRAGRQWSAVLATAYDDLVSLRSELEAKRAQPR